MDLLPSERLETAPDPDAAIIWLHGLGANGFDFVPIVPELKLADSLAVRFVFPHAPERPVTINGGSVMPAWYDILSMDIDRKVDVEQIIHSSDQIRALIDEQISLGIDSRRIILAGFSQGGAVAYHCALTDSRPLAGLMILSAYLATADELTVSDANQQLPIHVSHGLQDPVVPEILGQRAVKHLQAMGLTVSYQTWPMQHQVCQEQILSLSRWIQHVLTPA